ncbi:MAG: TetR/AcrR family transcriptional regulator C-terminal domain-containing protein, partial [Acetobacteraceae bacterium]|nr:TetR/AcrR family transcriptional regulator C-terminal domain-containing protein [Acetobacteraceae bacterium]
LHLETMLTPGLEPDDARIDDAVAAAVAAFLRAYGGRQ